MLKKLRKMLADKEARKTDLATKAQKSEDILELRSINAQLDSLNTEIVDVRSLIEAAEKADNEGEEPEFRSKKPTDAPMPEGELSLVGTFLGEQRSVKEQAEVARKETAEKRGKALMEGRSVTVGSSNVVLPQHDAPDIRPTFGEVSGLIDRVTHKFLKGGESFKQPYIVGYGMAGYTGEGGDYHGAASGTTGDADVIFGYAEMNKAKVTAYAEDSEELQKLPAADYDAEVQKGIRIASRKKLTREILVGAGGTNKLVGIFTDKAVAIDEATDLPIGVIDNTTLDEIVFSFGGDEEVEDPAVLILNKLDLKAFAQLRSADGKKIHTIMTNGNTGTIDGIPFLINSACKAISNATTAEDDYCMAYGPLSNYMLTIFSDVDIQRSTDYKFKEGMIAHRSSGFFGGNVVSKNGFLRVVKGDPTP